MCPLSPVTFHLLCLLSKLCQLRLYLLLSLQRLGEKQQEEGTELIKHIYSEYLFGKGSHPKKTGLIMEFFRKGGEGCLDPIHNFEAHFCASRVLEVLCKIKGYGHFWALFIKSFFLNMVILGVFGNLCFSLFGASWVP